jgi:outer membrane autotransporter protein
VIGTGASWIFRRSNATFNQSLQLDQASTLTVAGDPLNVGDVFVGPGATLRVDTTLDFAPNAIGLLNSGVLTGDGAIVNTNGTFLIDVDPTGSIRPGSSIGTLDITSDLRFQRGSELVAEVDPANAQNADLLDVTGAVTGIDDLTIRVEPIKTGASAADYVAANDYVVLRGTTLDGDSPSLVEGGGLPTLVNVAIVGSPSASGEIALAFSEITVTALPLQPSVTVTGNQNHASVAAGLANLAATAPQTRLASGTTLGAALGTLTRNQATALNTVHAEPFSSYQTVLLEDYDMVAGIVLGRAGGAGLSFGGLATPEDVVASTRGTGPGAAPRDVWGSVARVDGSVDGEGGIGDFGYSISGLVLGADILDDGAVQAGLFGAINRTRFDEHDLIDQEIEGDSYHLGAYASWTGPDGFTASGLVGFAAGRHESRREVSDVGAFTGGTAEADFDTRGFYLGAEVERQLEFGQGWSLTPSLAAVYAETRFLGGTESGGGDFNFTLEESTAESFMTTVGATLRRNFDAGGRDTNLLASLHYHHDWLADENASHEITVRNPILGSFTQVGQNRGAQGVTAGLGLSARISDDAELGAGYAYTWNENGIEHGIGASMLFTW